MAEKILSLRLSPPIQQWPQTEAETKLSLRQTIKRLEESNRTVIRKAKALKTLAQGLQTQIICFTAAADELLTEVTSAERNTKLGRFVEQWAHLFAEATQQHAQKATDHSAPGQAE